MCRSCFAAMSKMRNELFEKAGEALAKAGAVPTNTQRPARKRMGYIYTLFLNSHLLNASSQRMVAHLQL